MLIDLFQRSNLFISPTFVRSLIWCFDMHADQIESAECFHTKTPLGGVIRIEIACRARNIDAVPAEEDANAANQIDS